MSLFTAFIRASRRESRADEPTADTRRHAHPSERSAPRHHTPASSSQDCSNTMLQLPGMRSQAVSLRQGRAGCR